MLRFFFFGIGSLLLAVTASAQLAVQAPCAPTRITTAPPIDGEWWRCGVEGGWCPFEGEADVRYGAAANIAAGWPATWVVKPSTGPALCNDAAFGLRTQGTLGAVAGSCWLRGAPLAVGVTLPPGVDLAFGRCLFNSRSDFAQDVNGISASCATCHASMTVSTLSGDGLQRHAIRTVLAPARRARKVPSLRNVLFATPLGLDGRHGGTPGDVDDAILHAAVGAIMSPVEMRGAILFSRDLPKLRALVAFVKALGRGLEPDPALVPVPFARPDPSTAVASEIRLLEDLTVRVARGRDCFFGLLPECVGRAGETCVGCHPPPFLTNNTVTTNVHHPAGAWDTGVIMADGMVGPRDPGAGLVDAVDPVSGYTVKVGTFKVPSLWGIVRDEQTMHDGALKPATVLAEFYRASMGFKYSASVLSGLFDYWTRFCLSGHSPASDPITRPEECGL